MKRIFKGSNNWWNNLTLNAKQYFKESYERVLKTDNDYPHLVNTNNTRISKLTQNQICCIWRFKDLKTN